MKIFDRQIFGTKQLLSMDVPSPNPLDPERITHQYQQLQYCNYYTYVALMEQATGQTYTAMGVNASLLPASSSGHMQRIEGIPPGRSANSISKTREETYVTSLGRNLSFVFGPLVGIVSSASDAKSDAQPVKSGLLVCLSNSEKKINKQVSLLSQKTSVLFHVFMVICDIYQVIVASVPAGGVSSC